MRKIPNHELKRLSAEEYTAAEKLPVTVVLDNVRSMNNIGSFFRTCDAFLAECIVLCGITATPPNREIHKTALGAENSVVWEYEATTEEAIEKLKRNGYIAVAVEQVEGAVMLNDLNPQAGTKYALVFGNEVAGVAQTVVDLCDMSIEIPQGGVKHSLNVSVSAGVVLWEMYRKLAR